MENRICLAIASRDLAESLKIMYKSDAEREKKDEG